MLSCAARHLCSSAGGGKGVNYQGAAGLGVRGWGGGCRFFLGCSDSKSDELASLWSCGTVKAAGFLRAFLKGQLATSV